MEQLLDKYEELSLPAKIFLALALFVLAAWYSYTSNVEPAEQAITAAQTQDEEIAKQIEDLRKWLGSVTALEESLKKAQEDFTSLLELLPKDLEMERLLASFADAAKSSGVMIREFSPNAENSGGGSNNPDVSSLIGSLAGSSSSQSPSAPAPASQSVSGLDSVKKYPIKIIFDGSFAQTVTFFDKILSIPRIIRLESFTIKPAQKDTKSTTTSAETFDTGPFILNVEAHFTAYLQQGDLSVPQAQQPPAVSSNNPLPAPNALNNGQAASNSVSSSGVSPADGLSAKPLSAPGGGTP